MIQEIAPHIYDNAFAHRRKLQPEDSVLAFTEDLKNVLVDSNGKFPEAANFSAAERERMTYLFTIDAQAFFSLENLEQTAEEPEGLHWDSAVMFRTMRPEYLGFAGVTGMQLVRWTRNHRFCGRCGTLLVPSSIERAFCCEHCGNIVYPRICPGVIVAVVDKEKERLLLTRYAGRRGGNYALIAGFSEVGETLEETARREVMEEVGLKIRNLHYYASQPWSFSDTLLAGFYAELDGSDEIQLEREELSEGVWLSRDEIPVQDTSISLTGTMIERFRNGEE